MLAERTEPPLPTMAPKNVLILTPGRSGSSVLVGLLSSAGYWEGEDTATAGYETYEATRLIDLNKKILSAAGFGWHDIVDLPPPDVAEIRRVRGKLDPEPFREFLAGCDRHRPWVWKDPRLSYTIHFWEDLLDLDQCVFVVMNRDPQEAWTGLLRKNRLVVSESQLREIREACLGSARSFLSRNSLDYLELDFDDLVADPEPSLTALNRALNLSLTRADLAKIYRGTLGRQRWGGRDYFLGKLRYALEVARRNKVQFPRDGGPSLA